MNAPDFDSAAVFVAASLTASFVGAKFSIFTQSIYGRIEQGYK